MHQGTLLAAIDLGSNSFRLEIGRYEHGQIHRVEYLKETVRQGNGLDANRNLSEEAMARGWDCLARFSERLSKFQKSQVRAIATQTLREARNRDVFLSRACQLLGFPIEVISGTEEARLIYQGVAHFLPHDDERRLVIDIGGRSTELVLGQGDRVDQTASYRVGSVTWSMKYFSNGEFTEKALHQAEIAAQAVLEEALNDYPRERWGTAYGASGTVGAVADILALSGWPQAVITREGLDWLCKCLVRAGHAQNLRLEGLKEDRRAVIGGGVSVLRAAMDLLQIDELRVAQGALRHGVLVEMVTREDHDTDARDLSVQRLTHKFAVDTVQSKRVEKTAAYFLNRLLDRQPKHATNPARQVSWAALLHEIGMAISHSDYHKHGAYILDNADLLGFSMDELHRLGLLVLGHRGKLKKLESELEDLEFAQLLLSLRLAVILCHARKNPALQGLELSYRETQRRFSMSLPQGWQQEYPQSTHLLRQEVLAWQKSTYTFELLGA